MNLFGKICAAYTISCSVYTTWRWYKCFDAKRNSAVQQTTGGKSKEKTSNETPPSDTNTNLRVPDSINNDNTEYYNIIAIDEERYENEFLNIQSIVDGHTSSINEMKTIVEEQKKVIEEQSLINSRLLLKLNGNKTEETSMSDLYSADKKYFTEYCTRTNKRINEIFSKMSSLKSARVTKKELKALRRKFVNTKKHIMSRQSMQKEQFDEKISKIVRKYDKLKTKGDMMSLYTMGLKSCSFASMSTARNEFYLPEINTRNPNNAYQMPVDIATPTVQTIPKIPVPPPMPSSSSSSIANPSPKPSVAPPVPPVPPMPPKPPANLLDDYGRHQVTKSLLKTVTLGPIGDKPRKVKAPQSMIDARKKRAEAAMAAASVSSAVAVVADTTVTVHSSSPPLPETPEIPSLLLQVSEEVPDFPTLHVDVFENSLLDGDDETENDTVIPEEPNIPLPEIHSDATIVDEQTTPESASTGGINGVPGLIST